MTRLVKKRARLLRVRHVQHMLAVAETSRARDEAAHIESNAERLALMRGELFGATGSLDGATLSAQRELAARLEQAGRQLDGALYDANRRIEQKQALAIAADREREIAERLKDKARRAADDQLEARIAAIPQYRRMQTKGQGGI
ncbi:hypothetical protein LWE61_03545 [Sphingobium sufflavum]|uniref:hypothetical protein n=1 Tax=Sphingobium sufflavum TaxID=1129547 RepID=UPI001F1FCFF0|nr:hypothetical protein [Sphingobium sufflavum]MCE7795627.1 hypothetical protein [Sphingobium sufflavum]